jgi:hypothetical protein
MTAIERYEPPTQTAGAWVELLAPAAELARQIAGTEFVPKSMRGSVEKITACILFGSEIGIGPMQSLSKIDIVEGKPAPNAELGRALVLGAGHEFEVVEQNNNKVTVRARRRGSETWQTFSWTMDDARQAGLAQKDTYRKYPRRMLLARASADACKASFADCLGGISMFAEEVDDVEPTGAPAVVEATIKPPSGRARKLAPAPPLVEVSEELPPLPDEIDAPVEGITEPQTKKLMALFNTLEVKDRDDRMALCCSLTGRALTSSKDLTKGEASLIIDRLMAVEDGRADIVFDDGIPTISDSLGEAS